LRSNARPAPVVRVRPRFIWAAIHGVSMKLYCKGARLPGCAPQHTSCEMTYLADVKLARIACHLRLRRRHGWPQHGGGLGRRPASLSRCMNSRSNSQVKAVRGIQMAARMKVSSRALRLEAKLRGQSVLSALLNNRGLANRRKFNSNGFARAAEDEVCAPYLPRARGSICTRPLSRCAVPEECIRLFTGCRMDHTGTGSIELSGGAKPRG